jgi:hypothetical protein
MNPVIILHMDGDECWPDLHGREVLNGGHVIELALLRGGMASGRSSVTIRINLEDGRVVIAQTSLRTLLDCVGALAAAPGAEP